VTYSVYYFMTTQRMASGINYFEVYRAYCSHENYNEVFSDTISKFKSELNFDSVKSCLTFGPGEGQRDLQFIEKCVPNIKKIIAVEPDHESAKHLRARLEKSLPGVDTQVIETTIQSWKGLDDPVDLVLMIHVLYYLSANERKELLKKLREQWLTAEGRIVVVMTSRANFPGNAYEMCARLGTPLLSWEDTEPEILEAGFTKESAHEKQLTFDLSTLDESYLRFWQHLIDQPVTLDDIRNTIEETFPDGKIDQVFHMFAVLQ